MRSSVVPDDKQLDLIDYLYQHAVDKKEKTALIALTEDDHQIKLSWNELADAVSTASILIESMFRMETDKPRHVGYLSDNSYGNIILTLACMNLGLVEFPFDPRLDETVIETHWSQIKGLWVQLPDFEKQLITTSSAEKGPSNATIRSAIPLEHAALVLWTSGTTGEPKGVTLSRKNLLLNALAKLKAVPQNSNDRRLCVLPLCHGYARTCDLGTWLISGCMLAVASGHKGIIKMAPIVKPTLMNVVPRLAKRLLEDKKIDGIDQLRLLGCGGAGLSHQDFNQWQQERGVTVIQGYGLTETSPVICSASPENATVGVVGQFVEGWEYKIIDQQLYVRGEHLMMGYWNDPEETGKRIDPQGWLATGDLVEIDTATNQLRILGRADEVVVLDNGYKIHPQTIERKINAIGGVKHSMLILRSQLEIWLDLSFDHLRESQKTNVLQDAINQIMRNTYPSEKYAIKYFSSSLQKNELTIKGTIRRKQIVRNRLPH